MRPKTTQQVWLWRVDSNEIIKIQGNVSTARACRVYRNFDGKNDGTAIIMLPSWVDAGPVIDAIQKQRESVRT